jgi:hypothetical protein
MEETEILLEKFKIAATIQDKYNDLFWQRTTVFFAIISALFAGYGLISTEVLKQFLKGGSLLMQVIPFIIILMIFGGVGAYLSWLWLQIHKRATFLQNYYRFRAGVLEERIGNQPQLFAKSYEIATKEEASKKASKKSEKELEKEKQKKEEKKWKKLYGDEWQEKKAEWETEWETEWKVKWEEKKKELEKEYKGIKAEKWDFEKSKDPGSLRRRLDNVYLVFIFVWIGLSIVGAVILLILLPRLRFS